MNPGLDTLLGESPPAKIKVFAFNGDTTEAVCWLGIRRAVKYPQLTELFLLHQDARVEILSKKVVVQNLETREVIYDPRKAPRFYEGQMFITASETQWLKKNPHWPSILELEDNPVGETKEEENEDGLHA